MTSFSKVSERDKLKPRRDPYWQKISKGCYLGFRKMTTGTTGTWTARHLDVLTGKQVYKTLEDITSLPDHQRHDAAHKAAQAWFEHLGKGGSSKATTLTDACNNYVAHLRESKGDNAAENASGRFASYVLNNKRLCAIELSKLTPAHMADWRKSVKDRPTATGPRKGEKRSESTLNRDMTCLRAALNHAFNDGLVTSDFAWKSKLKPIKNADKKRNVYLDSNERRRLIEKAAKDAAQFLKGLCLVPLRPGALAALKVKSYDKRLKTLDIGKDKNGQDRIIALPDHTANFFSSNCENKLPNAPLLSQENGAAWNKDAWKDPVKQAASAANLPENVIAYALRHSTITDLVHGGLDVMTVAQLAGTSVLMIDKHYGHLTQVRSREALSRLQF